MSDKFHPHKLFDKFGVKMSYQVTSKKSESFDFCGFLHRIEDLRHSYEKFRFEGDVYKPPFEEVYRTVKAYIKDVLPREKNRDMEI